MEIIKNLSFSIALIIIGAIFLLFGLIGGFTIGNNNVVIEEGWIRGLTSFIGALLVVLSVLIERLKIKPRKRLKISNDVSKQVEFQSFKKAFAENFFYTLDEEPLDNFSNLVEKANRISILGRTAVNLLSQYHRVFEELDNSGCEIRLLFVDPTSEASKFLYGSNPEIYLNNMKTTCSHIEDLKNKMGLRFNVRVTKHAPTLSIIVIEKQEASQSFIRGQLYFLHSRVGRDRPIFRVNCKDRWFKVFMDEFNQLWTNGIEWDESCVEYIKNSRLENHE